MPVKADIILPKGATLIEEQEPQDTNVVLPKGATLIKEPLGKKKVDGASPSISPSTSPSLLEPEKEIKPLLTDDKVKDLIEEKKDLQKRIEYINRPSSAPGYVQRDMSNEKDYFKRIDEINNELTESGYNPNEAMEIVGDVPKLPGFGITQALQTKKDNPEYFNRWKSSIKWQYALNEAIKSEKGDVIAKNVIDDLIGGQVSSDYNTQRDNTRKIINAVYEYVRDGNEQQRLIKEIIKDRMYGYGVNLSGQEDAINSDPRLGALNTDQLRGLQFLEDTDPAIAESFDRLLSLTPQEVEQQSRNSSFRLGYQLKAKELEDIGLNLRQRALEEKMNSYVVKKRNGTLTPEEQQEANSLYAQWNEVLQIRDNHRENYPMAMGMDADRLMQDYLGARHGVVSKTLLGIGENADDVVNFAAGLVPFANAKDGRIDDLERFGSKQLGRLSQYDTKEEELFGRAYMPVFKGELKTQIDSIKNDPELNQEQKEDAVRKAILDDNFKGISYVSNDKSGKFNFTGKAVLNAVSNVASEIVPQIVLSYFTAGGANASRLQELTSLFTTTFAEAYEDYYTEAIEKNIANPMEYAALHTSVEAGTELFGNNIQQAKRLFAGTTAGKLIGKISEDEIWAIAKGNKGRFQNFLDAVGKTGKIAEKNARIEAFEELGGALGGNTIDKYAFNQEVALNDNALKDFVTTYVGMLPLGILGLPFQYKNVNNLQKRSLYEAATNPAKYFELLDEKVSNGTMNANDAFKIKQRISDGYELLKEMAVTKSDGSLMTDDEKTEYLFNKVAQKDIEKHIDEAPEEQKEKLEIINNRISRENGFLIEKDGDNDGKLIRNNRRLDLKDIDDKISELDEESKTYKSDRNRLEKEKQEIKDYYDNRLKLMQNEETETNIPEAKGEVNPESLRVQSSKPTLAAEKVQEAADFASELKNEGVIPDVYHNMITKENATPFWEMVAQQAQNRDSNWKPLEGEENKSEQAAMDAFGETIVNYANELFPPSVSMEEKAKRTYQEIVPVFQRMQNADYINENELNETSDKLYDILDQIDKSNYTAEQKKSSGNLIEPLIEKIENYEFRTKTQNRKVTETKTNIISKPVAKREITPALEQSTGSTVSIQFADGGTRKGTLNLRGGQYVLDVPQGEQIVIGEKAITDRDLKLPSQEEVENPIVFDENDNVKSVTFKTRAGSLVTIEDPEKALDLAIQLRADALGEVPQDLFDFVYEQYEKDIPEEVLVAESTSIVPPKSTQPIAKPESPAPKVNEEVIESELPNNVFVEQGTIIPPPTLPVPEVTQSDDNEYRDKAIIARIMKSKKVSKDTKGWLKLGGLKYKVQHQSEARQWANEIIDEYGLDGALMLAETGKFDGDINSMIFAVGLDRVFKDEEAAQSIEEKQKLAEQWADIAMRYQDAATSGGRFISAINDFYKKSPAGLVIKTEKEFKRRADEYFKGREKITKEAWEDFINTTEGKELLEEEITKRKKVFTEEAAKKVKAFFDKLRIDPKDQAGSYLVPPQIFNAAIDIIEQAVLGGVAIGKAIEQGIDYISEHHKDTWKVNEFRKDVKDSFKKQGIKRQVTEEDKEKILNKWRKKLRGMDERQRQALLSRASIELIDNGALEYDDFKKVYAEVIGLPQMTPELSGQLIELAKKINEPDRLKEEILKNKSTELVSEYMQSVKDAEKASTDLNELIGKQKWWFNTFISIMRLNTLSVTSLIGNVVGNVMNLPFRFITNLTGMGLDYLIAGAQRASDKAFGTTLYKNKPVPSIFTTQRAFARGIKLGTQQSIDNFFTGLTNKDYFQKEIKQNIRPIESAKRLWRNLTGTEKLSLNEKINAAIEAFPLGGMSAEVIARTLNIGDKGFRFAAEYAMAEKLSQQKGLTGVDKQLFTLFPDEESENKIREAGEAIVFQQKNIISQFLDRATAAGGSVFDVPSLSKWKPAFEIVKGIGYTFQPFLNTPLNVAFEFLHYMFPPLPLIKAARAIYKGDRETASQHLAQAVIGISFTAAATQLVLNGLIVASGGDEEKGKERAGIQAYQREGQLNLTGLKRWLAGGDAMLQDDDVWVDLKYYGLGGMLLLAKGRQHRTQKKEDIDQENVLQDLLYQFPAAMKVGLTEGVFSGTSSVINAFSMGGGYVDNLLLGMANVAENSLDPQWLRQFSLASNEYLRDTKGMHLGETAWNQLRQRLFSGEALPFKINIWGDKIENVPNKQNPYIWYVFAINKANPFDNDRFGYGLYDYYQQTKDYNIFPPLIKREVNEMPLTPKQYEQFSILVGGHRKQLIAPLFEGNTFNEIKALGHEEVVKYLQKIYDQGRKIAVAEFLTIYPEFQKTEE